MISQRYPWLEKYINTNPVSQFPSSLILEGEGGLGKTALAKYFAKKLLCEDESRPCGNCSSCSYFDAGSHPDYCFLSADDSSSGLIGTTKIKNDAITSKKIEGTRALNQFMSLTNSVSKRRVGVIFDAHIMNINSQNALLKTLEELPENKFIVLVSNQRRNFLPTIYSRSNLMSIQNPPSEIIDKWLNDQGFIEHSSLNFAPDSTPLAMEELINKNLATNYQDLTAALDSYCMGKINTFDLIKFFKELNIGLDEKIDAIILFLKSCLGITTEFYKPNSLIGSMDVHQPDARSISELIEELIQFKVALNKVASLNEQIGLSHFIFKLQALFR